MAAFWMAAQGARAQSGPAEPGPSIWDGVFTEAQAMRGKERYVASCGVCHSEDLLGGSGPALVGEFFMQRWDGTTVADMVQTVRQTMPQDSPDSLGTPGYTDLIAYLLQSNSAPSGSTELSPEIAALQRVRITLRAPSR
jgi:mono/diheme cytochrome c family protein